jgi:hypothetical protein
LPGSPKDVTGYTPFLHYAVLQVKGVAPFVVQDQLPVFLAVAAPFRDAYLAGCLGRLQDGVNTTFAGGARGLPTTAEVQKCIVQLHEELKAAGSSAQLGLQIGAVVRKAVRMLAERVEYMAAAGPELRQVPLGPSAGGGATPGQLRNIALCSQLQEVHRWDTAAHGLVLRTCSMSSLSPLLLATSQAHPSSQ